MPIVIRPYPRSRLRRLAAGVAAAALAFVVWVAYLVAVNDVLCAASGGSSQGGRAASEGWALVMGLALLVLAGVRSRRRPGRLGRLLVAFGVVYVAGLFVLWAVAPAVWGPDRCV